MKLLNSYECKEEAEIAERLIFGEKRLASERDGTETIYNLFGQASWNNFYKLEMFDLPLLKQLLEQRNSGLNYDKLKYQEIINMLKYIEKSFELSLPKHWLS